MRNANRRQRRRARKLGRTRRFTGRTAIVVTLVVIGLVFLTARVLADPGADHGSDDGGDAFVSIDHARLEALLRDAVERYEVPAMAALVIDADRTVAKAQWGRRARDMDVAVGPDDRWHVGSCTKAMTATLLACLVADEAARWEMTLGELADSMFADESIELAVELRPVTMEQLMAMRGGIPGNPPPAAWVGAWNDMRGGELSPRRQRDRFVRAVLAAANGEPGRFVYSNQAYAIVGHAIERLLDKEYESLLLRRLATPLGITTLGFGAPETPDALLSQPRGHRANGTPVVPGAASDNPPAIAPASRVHLSMDDWAKFARAHLRGAAEGCPQLGLDQRAFDRLHRVAEGEGEGDPYALGWIVRDDPDHGMTLWHNGSNTMWYAEMWLAPGSRRAILVVGNRGGGPGERAVIGVRRAILDLWREAAAAQEPAASVEGDATGSP